MWSRRIARGTGREGRRRRLRAVKAVVLGLGLAAVFIVGGTRAAFSDGYDSDANQFVAGNWVPRHVQTVGTATCSNGSTSTVTVASTVAAGSTLIVTVATRDGDQDPISAVDSRGNTYQLDAMASANKTEFAVLSVSVTTSLSPGDTITVTHTDKAKATAVVVDEFENVRDADRVHTTQAATGHARTSSVSASTPEDDALVVAGVAIHDSVTPSLPGWAFTHTGTASCSKDLTLAVGYRITATATTETFSWSWPSVEWHSNAIAVYWGEY